MDLSNFVLIFVATAVGAILLRPKVLRAESWRAVATPLASIIGSGFLVAAPILADVVGGHAWFTMMGLCAIAYLFGSAIRYNIAYLETKAPDARLHRLVAIDRVAEFFLGVAYFVSVAYYLNLFAAFGLRLFDVTDQETTRWGATVVIGLLGGVGFWKGLRGLEGLEVIAVGVKLALIAGVIAVLVVAFPEAWASFPADQGRAGAVIERTIAERLQVILGLIILVQGFETSRYLADEHSAAVRVRSMQQAQWIATAVYVIFLLLMVPYFAAGTPLQDGETGIIDMLAPISLLITPVVIAMALSSQFSAAVADMNGAAGLISAASRHRLRAGIGNVLTAGVALGITWSVNIYELITLASRAFVAYYAVQALIASVNAWHNKEHGKAFTFACAFGLALSIIIFAKPASV